MLHGKAHQDQAIIIINDIWRKFCEAQRELSEKATEYQALDSNYKVLHTRLMVTKRAMDSKDEVIASLRAEISQILKAGANLSTAVSAIKQDNSTSD